MRTLLIFGILIGQVISVQAGCKHSPVMRRLTAMTRYCMVTAESEKGTAKKCEYDCLVSKETIPMPANHICPITVKQRVFCDNTEEIISN